MSNLQTDYPKFSTRERVSRMLGFIARAYGINEQGLGGLLGVNQSTISRWLSGRRVSHLYYSQIVTLFFEASLDVRKEFPLPGNLRYVCSFAPDYSDSSITEAVEALRRAAMSNVDRPTCKTNSMQIDLHIRAVPLRRQARAHCFVDDPSQPRVFVILVADSLSLHEQHVVAFNEAYAHVMTKLIDQHSPERHPTSFI